MSQAEEGSEEAIDRIAAFLPEQMRRQARLVRAKAEEVLDASEDVYRLLKGCMTVWRDALGDEWMLQFMIEGDWLVEMEPDTGHAVHGDWMARCEQDSLLLAIPISVFNQCLTQDSRFALTWCAKLSGQMSRLHRQTERLRLNQVSDRITHYLATESVDGCGDITLPFPKYLWAAQLGIAPETLSRSLSQLEAEGRIERRSNRRLCLRTR